VAYSGLNKLGAQGIKENYLIKNIGIAAGKEPQIIWYLSAVTFQFLFLLLIKKHFYYKANSDQQTQKEDGRKAIEKLHK
jgi:hypothetical protein